MSNVHQMWTNRSRSDSHDKEEFVEKLLNWIVQDIKKDQRMRIMHTHATVQWHHWHKRKTHKRGMKYAAIATGGNPPNTGRQKHWCFTCHDNVWSYNLCWWIVRAAVWFNSCATWMIYIICGVILPSHFLRWGLAWPPHFFTPPLWLVSTLKERGRVCYQNPLQSTNWIVPPEL